MVTETQVLRTDKPDNIQSAVDILLAGGVVAFPTDTVYGIAAHGYQPAAIRRLYRAKQRPADKAIPLLVADPEDLARVSRHLPAVAQRLADAFWPGALTLIVPRADDLPEVLTAGGDSVAVRMPDHPIALTVIDLTGVPLAATSANRSGNPNPPITAADVVQDLGGRIDLVLDGGTCPGGRASTVLDLTRDPPIILRPGPVTREALSETMGRDVHEINDESRVKE